MLQHAWYSCGRSAIAVCSRLMLRLDTVHHVQLPAGPKIIAANHPTTTDPILITQLTSKPMHILITGRCFKIPVVGRALRLAGQVPVIGGRERAAFDEAYQLLRSGQNVAIFPEGALSPPEGGLQRPHTGMARLAMLTGAPVIPVGISLQHERIHCGETTIDHDTEIARWYLGGPYAMTAGEPIRCSGSAEDREAVRSVSQAIMLRIANLCLESASRLYASRAPESGVRPAQWARARRA